MTKPHRRPQRAGSTPNNDPRVLDYAAFKMRRDYVGAADRLPSGRKGMGRDAWRSKNASKGTHTPAIRTLREVSAAAKPLAAAGAGTADLLRLALDAVLPALYEVDRVSPLDGFWPLHRAETACQGAQDDAVTRYLTTGTAADRAEAMDATVSHMAALFRLYQRLTLDELRAALGESADALPTTVARFVGAADLPQGA